MGSACREVKAGNYPTDQQDSERRKDNTKLSSSQLNGSSRVDIRYME